MENKLKLGNPIHVFRDMGLGDVLLCTPALRTFREINPHHRIFFYTDVPEVIRGLPYIDNVFPSAARPPEHIYMGYDIPPPRDHLAKILGKKLGVRVTNVRPDCVVVQALVEKFEDEWRAMPRPHILIQRRAGPWTPNKNWPELLWERLLALLASTGTIIEIGDVAENNPMTALTHYLDLRNKTGLQELAACIRAADILIAPVSGPVHIAAAVGTPAVVIVGGYELPVHASYPGHKNLHIPISCSPCWIRTPCPINLECLKQITPDIVEQAVRQILASL